MGFQLEVIALVGALPRDDFVLARDHCDFDSVRFGLHGDCLLHVVVSPLFCVEALHLVLSQTVHLFGDRWNLLGEPNHALVAHRVEFVIVSGLQGVELLDELLTGILGDVWPHGVLEVGEESDTVLKFDLEGLIVDR